MMQTITVCASCLEPHPLNGDGLCTKCALFNNSLDGTLLALLQSEEDKSDK